MQLSLKKLTIVPVVQAFGAISAACATLNALQAKVPNEVFYLIAASFGLQVLAGVAYVVYIYMPLGEAWSQRPWDDNSP